MEPSGPAAGRAILGATKEAMLLLDGDGRIEDFNVAALELEPAVGKSFRELPRLADHPLLDAVWERVQAGHSWTGSLGIDPDQSEPFELTLLPMQMRRSCNVLAIVRTVSQAQRLDAQIAQSQKLEAIGRLAAGVAHNFNNMLAVILSHIDLALLDLEDTDFVREELVGIKEVVRSGSEMVDQMMAFSRQERPGAMLVRPGQILRSIKPVLQKVIREEIELEIAAPDHVRPVEIDENKFQHVIISLVINAQEAIAGEGKISLLCCAERLDGTEARALGNLLPGDYSVVEIRDTGCGMDETVRQRVFDPFFTTKKVGEGTGLGLATCLGIIDQAGGTITVESELGKGTRFRLYLPSHGRSEDRNTASTAGNSCKTILIAEDERELRKLLVKLLDRTGYHVIEAVDGQQAWEIIDGPAGDGIDIIVTDEIMPRLRGLGFLARALPRRPSVPAILISGFPNRVDLGAIQESSRVTILRKPFQTAELLRTVDARLREHS